MSDFYEGRPENDLTKALRHILEGGTKTLCIIPNFKKHGLTLVLKDSFTIHKPTPEMMADTKYKLLKESGWEIDDIVKAIESAELDKFTEYFNEVIQQLEKYGLPETDIKTLESRLLEDNKFRRMN